MSRLSDIQAFLKSEFPHSKCVIEQVGNASATVLYPVGLEDLRPGGTVSGPVMMLLADMALYVAVLGDIGIVPLTVTTSLGINFLRKPAAHTSLRGVCKLLKVGRSLAVGEVSLYSQGSDQLLAHATGTYAIPRQR